MPDGTTLSEAVELRLISPLNGPYVKLDAIEGGACLVLDGAKGYTQLLSQGAGFFIKIVTKDGREYTTKP